MRNEVVNPSKVLKTKQEMRTSSGTLTFVLQAIEYSEPHYQLVIAMKAKDKQIIHLKITNELLAPEFKNWLNGRTIDRSAIILPDKVEDNIMQFVKFSKTPARKDLILWILSRSYIYWEDDRKEIVFGDPKLYTKFDAFSIAIGNPFPKTTEAAIQQDRGRSLKFSVNEEAAGLGTDRSLWASVSEVSQAPERRRSSSTPATCRMNVTQKVTSELLGKSEALSKLSWKEIKGRKDAKVTVVRSNWTDDHFNLSSTIERGRRQVEEAVDERRKMLEVVAARQRQAIAKYAKIREHVQATAEIREWKNEAENETNIIQKMMLDVEEDMQRQRCRAQRESELVRRTMAPPGFASRSGVWIHGPHLGPGPLPPDATSKLVDPALEETLKHYDWDQHGRRHRKLNDDNGQVTALEVVMEKIRTAANNPSLYKSDLHGVFVKMDSSRDGRLSKSELLHGLQQLGVDIDQEGVDEVFRFFDPNNNGWINYGEFIFSFFNRREFYRKLRLGIQGKTKGQIAEIFHLFDRIGDGALDHKDLRKLLSRLKISLTEKEIDMLLVKFDRNKDNKLDLSEFTSFLESLEATCGRPVRPHLGPGPLPPDATSKLVDPALEETLKHYDWDQHGRRHHKPNRGKAQANVLEAATKTVHSSTERVHGREKHSHAQFMRPSTGDNVDFEITKSVRDLLKSHTQKDNNNTAINDKNAINHTAAAEYLDKDWVEKILQRQKRIEAMVGKDLFK